MAKHEELLREHQPILKYDSLETYFADSAAEWTDLPGNELRHADGELIAAKPREDEKNPDGVAELSLDFLGGMRREGAAVLYPNGREVLPTDYIGSPERSYRARYEALRGKDRARYANRVYGRAVEEGGQPRWLQYWFWYFYNDYNLAHRIGLHEGDWEMIQLRLGDDGTPQLAVYAQHTHAEERDWREVETQAGRPVAYVGRGSHASYFEPGEHQTDVWYDLADGRREAKDGQRLEFLDDLAWARWPGVWGDTPARPGRIRHHVDQPSPTSPCRHKQWDHPAKLTQDANVTHQRLGDGRQPPPVKVRRRRGRLWFAYRRPLDGEPPYAVQLNVNASEDPTAAPRAYTFEVSTAAEQSVSTVVELARDRSYQVFVAVADANGRATNSELIAINRFPPKLEPRSALLPLGWLTHVWRRARHGPTEAPPFRQSEV